ncbi:MAG TPA: hypothetical protein VE954_27335 [Oligoflexus sp.]|uniref:hypothetical protein n=1 Tax=Oligoflexus sp. TaxID=1971216 RepID=UPI002D411495|nr:hypothetical protein [Oligoflexus sp.]HYX36838.1 hypothetical protein [Oligoflexus sp.]
MRAAVYTQYGPPEVVTIQEVMTPSRRKNEVLVRVHASTVKCNDRGFRTPEYPFIIKPVHGFRFPLEQIVEAYRYLQAEQKLGNVVVAFG